MAIEWGGISRFADELCAALFDDSSDLTSQQVATIELRKALEPLLNALVACKDKALLASPSAIGFTYSDLREIADLAKEGLAKWR